MLGLKLNHVSKRGPRYHRPHLYYMYYNLAFSLTHHTKPGLWYSYSDWSNWLSATLVSNHCGLVTPYDVMELCNHHIRWWNLVAGTKQLHGLLMTYYKLEPWKIKLFSVSTTSNYPSLLQCVPWIMPYWSTVKRRSADVPGGFVYIQFIWNHNVGLWHKVVIRSSNTYLAPAKKCI